MIEVRFSVWKGGEAIFQCEGCGALVGDGGTDDHADFHVDIAGVDDTLGVGTPDLEDRVRRMNAADAQRGNLAKDYHDPEFNLECAVSPQGQVLHTFGGLRYAGGQQWIKVTSCGVHIEPNYWESGYLEHLEYDRRCSKCFLFDNPNNFYCEGGSDHQWPPELDGDARCEVCGLPYAEWSE